MILYFGEKQAKQSYTGKTDTRTQIAGNIALSCLHVLAGNKNTMPTTSGQ
jgi:hypothetical protein